jgi:hypothetical protein
MKQLFLGFALFLLVQSPIAQAVELVGLISYDLSAYSKKPANYSSSGGGIGYAFFGREDLGPGLIETGLMYTATSITTQEPFGTVKTSGSFWIIPLLYRVYVVPPFLSVAIGPDYAILSSNQIEVEGSSLGTNYTSGYRSHFGVEGSVEALQDLGENLSAVLDIRYRYGLADTLSLSGNGVRYQTYFISLGIQKRLE